MGISELLSPGTVVGAEFTVVRPLGEGGMGAVFVVEQATTGKQRALKVMHREIVADAQMKHRFEQEARVASRIHSEHIVQVFTAGVDAPTGLPYLVMELLDGEDLHRRVRGAGPLSTGEVAVVFEQLCHAMFAAHQAGVIHRDLKPENVFLARSLRAGGHPFTVKVLDFGIAKISAEAGPRVTQGAMGSPLWMAPEQTTTAPVTPATDVWALGLIAYELFTGGSFWRSATLQGATTAQLLREVVLDPLPSASQRAHEQGVAGRLPPGFDLWFARCVAREPAHRFPDAGAVWHALQALLQHATPSAHPPTAHISTGPPPPPLQHVAPRSLTPAGQSRSFPATSRSVPFLVYLAVAPFLFGALFLLGKRVKDWDRRGSVAEHGREIEEVKIGSDGLRIRDKGGETAEVHRDAVRVLPADGGRPRELTAPSQRIRNEVVRLVIAVSAPEGNVSESKVKSGLERNAAQLFLCYEKTFATLKDEVDLPEGSVEIDAEVGDQLLRHPHLKDTTFEKATLPQCLLTKLDAQRLEPVSRSAKARVKLVIRFIPDES